MRDCSDDRFGGVEQPDPHTIGEAMFLEWLDAEIEEMQGRHDASHNQKLQASYEGWVQALTYVKETVESGHFEP
jgi:hypothetical protein